MKILISTPNINLNISKVVGLLKKLNYLDSFWTTFFLPFKIKFIKRSYYKEINLKFVKFVFFKELMRKVCLIFNLKKLYSNDDNIFSVSSINKDLDIKVAKYIRKKNKINIIYSYEDCSKESFKAAKYKNIKTIYDLTSPYWRLKKKYIRDPPPKSPLPPFASLCSSGRIRRWILSRPDYASSPGAKSPPSAPSPAPSSPSLAPLRSSQPSSSSPPPSPPSSSP